MRKLTLFFGVLSLVIVLVLGCSSKKQEGSDSVEEKKGLVCYFSATGTTEKVARRLAEITGFKLYNIEPMTAYSEQDLDWRDSLSRCYVEMHDFTIRPALKDSVTDLSAYDVVFIGYPNWWNTHPTIINTFIEHNDLAGKKIIPFMTSGGSDIINSEKELQETYPSLNFGKGLLMNDVSDDDIRNWLKSIDM